jgi:SAM-dependent methyltransferase
MAKTASFDRDADAYEAWYEQHKDIFDAEVGELKKLVAETKNGVEIGMGSGRFADALGIREGVEPSKAMRDLAHAKGLLACEGVAEALPFEDERFDFALMMTVICFVDDPLQALRECFRVVRRGGFVIIGFVAKDSVLGKQYEEKKQKSRFYAQATFYTQKEVEAFAQAAGFVVGERAYVAATQNSYVLLKCEKH